MASLLNRRHLQDAEQARLEEIASAMLAGAEDDHEAMERILNHRRYSSCDTLTNAYNLGQKKAELARARGAA